MPRYFAKQHMERTASMERRIGPVRRYAGRHTQPTAAHRVKVSRLVGSFKRLMTALVG